MIIKMRIVGENKSEKNKKIKITFVCTGNTCRSPMAEFIFKDYLKKHGKSNLYTIKSAGLSADTGETMATNARLALKEMGIKTTNRKAKPLTQALVDSSDFIICMTQSHAMALQQIKNKVTTVAKLTDGEDVGDPYGQGIDVYRKVAEHLAYLCEDIINKIG